ncbi:hypothetical protein [Bacillus xiapuensis]|uniref:hypothetical protein n=1 Tax=Bacillus xiapuensis TaxID=2014075 RepID=UPI000C241251|nr:hypothetical protein [Bacillus xiapuensis]
MLEHLREEFARFSFPREVQGIESVTAILFNNAGIIGEALLEKDRQVKGCIRAALQLTGGYEIK